MCAIVGMAFANQTALASIKSMTDALYTRGPDGSGIWIDEASGVGFGHRRLAIIDLSAEGHQPMHSASDRYVISFNGEIYNFAALRLTLEQDHQARFRGHSDTEVLLSAIEHWGLEKTLGSLVGMFAFALWDKATHSLHLARDRFGEKPLYYGWINGTFVFASELKGVHPFPQWQKKISLTALENYLAYGYVPTPLCIFEGLHKLPPGHSLSLDSQRTIKLQCYWSVDEVALKAKAQPLDMSFTEARQALDSLLTQAVGLQSHADVPVGAFLSGGIDSSTIVALMQAQAKRPVHTFSIGFSEASERHFSEAEFAKTIAQHLGTEHQELYVSAQDCQEVIQALPEIYDEPLADASQIPTYLVAKLARSKVTVALSGDGGDELFGGYKRYALTARHWQSFKLTPYPLRKLCGRLLPHLPNKAQSKLGFKLRYKYPDIWQQADSAEAYYQAKLSSVQNPAAWLTASSGTPLPRWKDTTPRGSLSYLEWMMLCDQKTYLSDQIIPKVDRAAMALSLETRIPLLDHRVVEFAWQLPEAYKFHSSGGKYLLRELLYQYVPKDLLDRPKMGFNVPLARWLRGGLKPWAEALLDKKALEQQGFWQTDLIQHYWQAHQANIHNNSQILWNILMFQAWIKQQGLNA